MNRATKVVNCVIAPSIRWRRRHPRGWAHELPRVVWCASIVAVDGWTAANLAETGHPYQAGILVVLCVALGAVFAHASVRSVRKRAQWMKPAAVPLCVQADRRES